MKKGFRRSPSICKYPEDIRRIYALGIPNIIMQATYTFYIFGLNMILAGFSDEAVTALGLYYKWQTFFFIPLGALQTCIVPIISYNYAAKSIDRCKHTMTVAYAFCVYEGQRSYPYRSAGIPIYWDQLYTDGRCADLSGLFAGNRRSL